MHFAKHRHTLQTLSSAAHLSRVSLENQEQHHSSGQHLRSLQPEPCTKCLYCLVRHPIRSHLMGITFRSPVLLIAQCQHVISSLPTNAVVHSAGTADARQAALICYATLMRLMYARPACLCSAPPRPPLHQQIAPSHFRLDPSP